MTKTKAHWPVVGFNLKRAAWARESLEAFMRTTGLEKAEGYGTAISDLLADLMHLADLLEQPFVPLFKRARRYYRDETGAICRRCERRFDGWSDRAGAGSDECIECSSMKGGGL
mgnify:CR=1 FL=1